MLPRSCPAPQQPTAARPVQVTQLSPTSASLSAQTAGRRLSPGRLAPHGHVTVRSDHGVGCRCRSANGWPAPS
eukprot:89034-Hanusia_phi.AAC.1